MKRFTIVSILVFSSLAGVFALDGVDFRGGLTWIGSPPYTPASDDGAPTGAPSPILNAFGISFPVGLGGVLHLEPGLTLFGTQYAVIPGYTKTVPVEREYASAVWFLSALVDLSLVVDIPLSQAIRLGFDFGAAFHGRIPIGGWGDGWDQLDEMAAYFYGQARYLYPLAGLRFSWKPPTSERLELIIRGRSYFPLFHAWDGEEVGFVDQFLVSGSIGLRILPGATQTP